MLTLCLSTTSPEARDRRIVRHALEHESRRAVGERSVDDVAVAGHPPDIRRTPVDIAVVVVEDVLVGHRRIDKIAARRVEDAFRSAGRARREKNEQRVFRIHFLGLTHRRGLRDLLVVPDVAAMLHGHLATGALDDDHRLDEAGLLDGGIGVGLQRHLLGAAQAFVGGDQHLRLAALDPSRERIG